MSELIARLNADLAAAYGDMKKPRFEFVAKRLETHMHEGVLRKLRTSYSIQDTTDLDDDMALTLCLTRQNVECGLRLSFVGKYAVVADRQGSIVSPDEHTESVLVELLRCSGYDVLEPVILERRVDFGEPGETRSLFGLLFSDFFPG